MNVYYLISDLRQKERNARGVDYTPAYIPALLAWMGVSGRPVNPDSLEMLTADDVLLANEDDLAEIPGNAGAVILLGRGESLRQRKVFAHFLYGEEKIPVFVPFFESAGEGEILYYAEDDSGNRIPALIRRNEKLYDFRFDLCATVWFSGDGFLPEEPSDYFFIGRTPDARPSTECRYSASPWNDHLLLVLEDLLDGFGVPRISKLPLCEDGSVPDFALHISGDDDYTSAEFNLNAARTVHELGLPYHINAMPGGDRFIITPEQAEELASLGCELALHTDFTAQPYTLEGQKHFADAFRKYFGAEPVTNVNHCLIEGGTAAERMRWLAQCGILADNGKLGEFDPSDINAFNLMGFGFGTSFPRYTCDDSEHGNALIGCMEIPLTYYEPRLGGTYGNTEEMLRNYVDGAAEEGRIMQFFVHPHYFWTESPHSAWSTAALKFARSYWEQKGYKAAFTSTNRIAEFWTARKNAVISAENGTVTVKCEVPCALILPRGTRSAVIDGKTSEVIVKRVSGREIRLAVLREPGEHTIICES